MKNKYLIYLTSVLVIILTPSLIYVGQKNDLFLSSRNKISNSLGTLHHISTRTLTEDGTLNDQNIEAQGCGLDCLIAKYPALKEMTASQLEKILSQFKDVAQKLDESDEEIIDIPNNPLLESSEDFKDYLLEWEIWKEDSKLFDENKYDAQSAQKKIKQLKKYIKDIVSISLPKPYTGRKHNVTKIASTSQNLKILFQKIDDQLFIYSFPKSIEQELKDTLVKVRIAMQLTDVISLQIKAFNTNKNNPVWRGHLQNNAQLQIHHLSLWTQPRKDSLPPYYFNKIKALKEWVDESQQKRQDIDKGSIIDKKNIPSVDSSQAPLNRTNKKNRSFTPRARN